MTKRMAYASVLIFIILTACSKSKQEGEIYFPEGKVGSTWEYLVKISTPSGDKDAVMSIRTEGTELINGKKYMKNLSLLSIDQETKTQKSYSRRTSEGIYKIDPLSKDKAEFLNIPFPVKVGTTWAVKKSDGQFVSKAEKIDNIEYLGKTYMGCLKITIHSQNMDQPLEGVSYFAPGVGEVTTILKIGDTSITYVLNKYKL